MLAQKHIAQLGTILLSQLLSTSAIAVENPAVSVSGTVQDRAANPIHSARVFVIDAKDEWSTKTDELGAFELRDVPASGAFLFVDREGFRFHGEQLTETSKPILRKLTHLAEPTTDKLLAGRDWSIETDERLKFVHRVFEPYLEHVVTGENENERFEALVLLAKIDPTRTLTLVQQNPFKQRQMVIAVRNEVVDARARVDAEAAIGMAERLNHPYVRGSAYIRITQVARDMPKPDRIALLVRAAADAKSVKNLAQRIELVGRVADALLDAGEQATAKELLRDSQRQASRVANPAWAGVARSSFAKALAHADIDSALPLVTELPDDSGKSRYLGNIAHELAAINPAGAERVLNMIERPAETRLAIAQRDSYAVRVCYRMATKDLPRAMKIAESCRDRNQQAHAYGVIAHAIATENREEATQLVRRAYDLLKVGNRDPQTFAVHDAAQIAGCLLPTAEHVDPTLVQEMIWRTISLRTPRITTVPTTDEQNSQLASWLSRHDRTIARAVLDHWHGGIASPYSQDQYTVALTLIDPARAVEFAESQDKDNIPSRLGLVVARTLMAEGDDRIRVPHDEAELWAIDVEDGNW